jgi:hypothetical protein
MGANALDTLDNTRQMKVVTSFCIKPYSEPGKKRSSAEHVYDWTYLVRQIAYFDSGKTCDDAAASEVAKILRKAGNFPNDSDWKTRVSAPGAPERILEIIREGLAAGKA